MTFHDFIRQQLEFHSWTERDLSRFTGLDPEEVKGAVQGPRNISSSKTQKKLSGILGVSTELLKSLK